MAIDTLAELKKQNVKVNYRIYGTGPLKNEIEYYAKKKNISISIKSPENDLSKIFMGADLFLLTSSWEGFGNVVVESMAFGITPVVVDCPGGAKDIVGKKFGYVVKQDALSISRVILEAYKNKIGKNILRERAIQYDQDRISAKILRLLWKTTKKC